jgi:hypothetical protein
MGGLTRCARGVSRSGRLHECQDEEETIFALVDTIEKTEVELVSAR